MFCGCLCLCVCRLMHSHHSLQAVFPEWWRREITVIRKRELAHMMSKRDTSWLLKWIFIKNVWSMWAILLKAFCIDVEIGVLLYRAKTRVSTCTSMYCTWVSQCKPHRTSLENNCVCQTVSCSTYRKQAAVSDRVGFHFKSTLVTTTTTTTK